MLSTYSEHRPTQFDSPGLGLNKQQDWLVAPVSQTRDSGALDRSNFDATLRCLGGESDTVEVHRFGHWGPGWYEIILIDPKDEARVKEAQEIEDALSDYPIVDESLFSEYEHEECAETWERFSVEDRIAHFRRHSYSATSLVDLLQAIKGGSWYHASHMLNCPSELLG